jgi:hypothetical protein
LLVLMMLLQGVIGLSRKNGQCSGFIKIGSNAPAPLSDPKECPDGAALMGVQILFGYNYSVTISDISIDAFNNFPNVPSSIKPLVTPSDIPLPVTPTAASPQGVKPADLGLLAPAGITDGDSDDGLLALAAAAAASSSSSVAAAAAAPPKKAAPPAGAEGAAAGVKLPAGRPIVTTAQTQRPTAQKGPAAAAVAAVGSPKAAPRQQPLPAASPAPAVQPAAVQSAEAAPEEPLCEPTEADDPIYPNGFIPKGVGGGGPLSSFSMSPYTDLWLVGTKAGTMYRTANRGSSWTPIDQDQLRMTSDLPFAPPVGFGADGKTLFFAPCWGADKNQPCVAKRSSDAGVTWEFMDVNSNNDTVFDNPTMPPNNQR